MTKWIKIGNGAYNKAYRSEDGLEVLKIQIITSALETNAYDTPERSVRLWNELNSHILPPARVETIPGLGKVWICPFIEGRQSTDEEISKALIKIFNAYGRVIIDAAGSKNFVTKADGQVVCLDIGQALELERRDGEFIVGGRTRRKSITSIHAWRDLKESHIKYLNHRLMKFNFPETSNMVKALLFLKLNYPDITDVSFLQGNKDVILQLVHAFDSGEKVTVLDLGALVAEASEESALVDSRISKRVRQVDVVEVVPVPAVTVAAPSPVSAAEPADLSHGTGYVYAAAGSLAQNPVTRDFLMPSSDSHSARLRFFAGGLPLLSAKSSNIPDSSKSLGGVY